MNDPLQSVEKINRSRASEEMHEEFNNFMFKVNEVSNIVGKLASQDRDVQKMGDVEARKYLGEDKEKVLENLDDGEEVVLTVKNSKTVINRKALEGNDNRNQNEMSQEAFMAEMSKDADRRYKDKQIRKEKMETLKKQANNAFRRGEYEKALTLYNKAIDLIRDSLVLYNNRALTYIHLKLYDKAKHDLTHWALRLDEDCLKTWLLLSKIHFLTGNKKEFRKATHEAKSRNPGREDFIDEYITNLEDNVENDTNLDGQIN